MTAPRIDGTGACAQPATRFGARLAGADVAFAAGTPLEFVAPLPEGIRNYIAAVDAEKAREFTADNLEQILGKRL